MSDHSAVEATYLLLLEEYKMLRANAAEFTRTQGTLTGFGVTAVALVASRGGRTSWVVAASVSVLLLTIWLFYVADLRRMRRHLVSLEDELNRAGRAAHGIGPETRLLSWESTVSSARGDFLNLTVRPGKSDRG